MVAVRRAVGDNYGTATEDDVASNTYAEPTLIADSAVLQVTGGTDASSLTIQRHPVLDNTGRNAPAAGSPKWVNHVAPANVAGAAGAVVNITNVGACWIRYKIANGADFDLTYRKP